MTNETTDCGEAGHAEGRCGTTECLRGKAPVYIQPFPGDYNTASPWLLHLHQGLHNLLTHQTDAYWRGYLGAMLTHIEALVGEPPRECGCPVWCGDRAGCTPDVNHAELVRRAGQALVQAATIKGLVLTVEQAPVAPLAMGRYLTTVTVRKARGAAC